MLPLVFLVVRNSFFSVRVTRVTKIENKSWEGKTAKLIYIKGQEWEIASSVEYRMGEQLQNLSILGILKVFQIEIFLKIC